jgi:flagellar protein FliJ
MKSLSTLIKLQKTRVDEQRLIFVRLQEKLDHVDMAILTLESQKMHEQAVAKKSPENAVTYGAFLKQAIKRGRSLAHEREIAAAAVEAARAKLTDLFEEQKRYEIAEAARVGAELREEMRRETVELDEIGGVTHERRGGDR